MDRLDIAIGLIKEAQAEKARLQALNKEIEKLKPVEDWDEYYNKRYKIEESFSPLPHKSIVNDNLKVARRILRDEYL